MAVGEGVEGSWIDGGFHIGFGFLQFFSLLRDKILDFEGSLKSVI